MSHTIFCWLPVAWIISILRSLVGHFAGLLLLLGLNTASLAMNRLLYSMIMISLLTSTKHKFLLETMEKDQRPFFVGRCATGHWCTLDRAATRKSGAGRHQRHHRSWNPTKPRRVSPLATTRPRNPLNLVQGQTCCNCGLLFFIPANHELVMASSSQLQYFGIASRLEILQSGNNYANSYLLKQDFDSLIIVQCTVFFALHSI